MKKRVFIVHGWDGYPEEGWFPWLKKAKEFAVFVPQLPEAAHPRIGNWVSKLAEVVGIPVHTPTLSDIAWDAKPLRATLPHCQKEQGWEG